MLACVLIPLRAAKETDAPVLMLSQGTWEKLQLAGMGVRGVSAATCNAVGFVLVGHPTLYQAPWIFPL